jgi:hypothetical protein
LGSLVGRSLTSTGPGVNVAELPAGRSASVPSMPSQDESPMRQPRIAKLHAQSQNSVMLASLSDWLPILSGALILIAALIGAVLGSRIR